MAEAKTAKEPFVPAFFARLGVKPGEWMYTSKLTIKALMRPSWPLKVRIWACLMIQSFGYEADLAVVMKKGKYNGEPRTSPLSPFGIDNMLAKATSTAFIESGMDLTPEMRAQLRIGKQHMRRALAEMEEADGLVVRCRLNCKPAALHGKTLETGIKAGLLTRLRDIVDPDELRKLGTNRVAIFLLAKPEPARNLDQVARSGYLSEVKSFPVNNGPVQLLFDFMRKNELKQLISRAEKVASREDIQAALSAYQSAMEALTENFKQFLLVAIPSAEPIALKAPPAPIPQLGLFVVAKNPDFETVLNAMQQFCHPDDEAVEALIRACRENTRPQPSAVQIAESVRIKGPLAIGKDNPVGFLLTSVPRLFKSSAYAKQQALAAEVEASQLDRQGRGRQFLEALLQDASASEEDKKLAREGLAHSTAV